MPLYTRSGLLKSGIVELRKAVVRSDSRSILKEASAAPIETGFDIFLSHRYLDADAVLGLKLDFEAMRHTVYVDWLVDDLDRGNVTRDTALRLRERMKHCRSLFFAFSPNARSSQWMPWELGFCDGAHGRVAIVPVLDQDVSTEKFEGQEYLSLYPYVSKASPEPKVNWAALGPGAAVQVADPVLWVNNAPTVYTAFTSWLGGAEPSAH